MLLKFNNDASNVIQYICILYLVEHSSLYSVLRMKLLFLVVDEEEDFEEEYNKAKPFLHWKSLVKTVPLNGCLLQC